MFYSQRKHMFEQPNNLVYSRKLDTALRGSTCEFAYKKLLDNHDDVDTMMLQLICEKSKVVVSDLIVNHHVYSDIIHDTLLLDNSSIDIAIHASKAEFNTIQNLVYKNFSFQYEYLYASSPSLTRVDINHHVKLSMRSLMQDKKFLRLVMLQRVFSALIEKLPRMDGARTRNKYVNIDDYKRDVIKTNYWSIPEIGLIIRWSEKCCIVSYDNCHYLLPRPYILLMHNKISDAVSVLTCARYSDGLCLERGAYDITMKFFIEMIRLSIKYRQNYYSIIKCLEGFVAGEIMNEADNYENSEFIETISTEVSKKLRYNYMNSRLRRILLSASIPLRNELGCMMKLLGHPFVDMEAGARAIHKATTEKLDIKPQRVLKCVQHCKKDFIKSYVLRHRKWPLVELDQSTIHKGLETACLKGLDPDSASIKAKFGSIELEAYNSITILKCMEFNYLENYIPYLKDKTVSVIRSKAINKYINKDPDEKWSWKDTRLLLVFLTNSALITNHKKYIQKYINSATLDDILDYLIIRLVPKEKEMKIEFRGFGCKTYEDRARSLAQEKNVMHFLDLYSDEQAMTIGELELTKKLYAYRTIFKSYPGYTPLYINIDAAKWNNRFRHEVVHPVCDAVLDRVFDTPIFSKTQLAFQKGFMIVPDEEECYYWDGQEGGIEGLNQDTWVVTYINQIKACFPDLHMPMLIFCKGDDFRFILLVPPYVLTSTPLLTLKNRIMEQVSANAREIGHDIKIEESYGSQNYFVFSKAASIKDIELPQTYRKIQKTYGSNNAFLCTLDEYIASTYSNGHSASRYGVHPLPCFLTSMTWMMMYVTHSQYYNGLNPDMIVALSLVPSTLGGFPIIYYHNFFTRSESDLLSPFIGMVLYSICHYPNYYRYLRRWLCQRIQPVPKMFTGLLADPYSLPIVKPSSAMTVLRQAVGPSMQAICKNEWINQLFRSSVSSSQKYLESSLMSSNVYDVKIMSSIYAASAAGLVQELTRRFESGRSVYELLLLRGGYSQSLFILRKALRAEYSLHTYRCNVITGLSRKSPCYITEEDSKLCPADVTNKIRNFLWGKEIYGISMPPLQHQVELTTPNRAYNDDWAVYNHFLIDYHKPHYYVDPNFPSPFYASSRKTPFLGFRTSSGTMAPSLHMVEKDAMLSKIKDLLMLYSWVLSETYTPDGKHLVSTYPELIEQVIKMYTNVPLTSLLPFAHYKRSGTVDHHVMARGYKSSIIPNMLSNLYLCVTGESNSHLSMRNTHDHYEMNMLNVYCHGVSLLLDVLPYEGQRTTSYWLVTTNCIRCNTPIRERVLVHDTTILIPEFQVLQYSKLEERSLKVLYESLAQAKDIDYKDPTVFCSDLDFTNACVGMLQDLVFSSYTMKKRYQDKFTGHIIGSEGLTTLNDLTPNVNIGMASRSELKRIPIDIMFSYLRSFVLMHASQQGSVTNMCKIENYISCSIGSHLPWYGLMQMYMDLGMTTVIAKYIEERKRTQSTLSYTDPARMAKTVGLYILSTAYDEPIDARIIILNYYTPNDISPLINPWITCFKMRFIHDRFEESKLLAGDIESFNWCIRYMILMSLMPDASLSEVNDDIIRDITDNKTQITFDYLDYVDCDIFDEIIYDQDSWNDCMFMIAEQYDQDIVEEHLEWLSHGLSFAITYLRESYMILSAEIHYSDLKACIDMVQSRQRIVDRRDHADTLLMDTTLKNYYRTVKLNVIKEIFNAQESTFLDIGNIPSFNYDYSEHIVNDAYGYRPYGAETSYSSCIDEIMSSFLVSNKTLENLNVLCLGEEKLGVSSMLSAMVTNSNVVFCQVPPNTDHDYVPVNTEKQCKIQKNVLDLDMISDGLFDTSQSSTYSRVMLRYSGFDIITFGIKHSSDDVDNTAHYSMFLNHLNFISRDNSCVIIANTDTRVNLSNSIVCFLGKIYEKVFVYFAKSLGYSCTYFIIGVKKHPNVPISTTYDIRKRLGPRPFRRLLQVFRDEYDTRIHSILDRENVVVLDEISNVIGHSHLRHHMPIYWISQCLARLDLLLPAYIEQSVTISKPDIDLPFLEWALERRNMLVQITDSYKRKTKKSSSTTLATVVQHSLRLLTYEGLLFFMANWNVNIHTDMMIKNHYRFCIESLPSRLQWGNAHLNPYLIRCPLLGIDNELSPYKAFLRGYELGLSYWSWTKV